jgi:DUF177 domain-containing protein
MTDAGRRGGTRATDDQPLVWNVAGLLGESPGAARDYAFPDVSIDLGEDLRLASPISGRVHLARTNRGLLVDADASTSLAMECARCLRDISVPIDVEIQSEALPTIDIHTGAAIGPTPEEADEDVIRLTDHHELDLETPIREAIQLAEPIAPLCREDCPGLCLVCGERLEDGTHDHPDEDIDPRLEALKAFRPE